MKSRGDFRRLFVVLLFFSICGLGVEGQDRKELEEKKSKTQQEIEYSSRILQETQGSRRSTMQRVRILDKRIQLRNEIIASINGEIQWIENDINQKSQTIDELERDLKTVREEYAKLIVKAYWNKDRRDWLMFVMSAENFNQAYRRMKYLQQFSRYRRNQAELIEKLKDDIATEITELEAAKIEKEKLALEKRNENHALELEKNTKNQMISGLAKREKELKEEIAEKKRIASRLESEIKAIIEEEARKARSRNIYEQLTPEEKLISDNFMGNKGKLPWPVERGIITGQYGEHPHPVLKQVMVDNDGIDISTVKGAEARASFDGEVTKIVAILGRNYTVILRHGNFLTVYQNLVDLKVKQGDKVKVKQVLGTIYTDNESSNTTLHMEIWRERSIQNPEEWLSRKSG